MISLSEALKLTKPTDRSMIWLRQAGKMKCGLAWDVKPMTLKNVREKFDMKAVMVHEIRPCFICEDYEGFEYVVTGPGFDKKG